MLATPNHEDFFSSNQSEADKGLLVRFFIKEREDKEATMANGRPMFKDTEYVEIRIAGKRDAQACRPATHADTLRFPEHYRRFKLRIEEPTEGTPLSEWPQITRSLSEHLSFLNIKTVEQLTAASDTDMSKIHGGVALKQRAAAFLENSNTTKLIAEKEALENRLAANEKAMAEMQETMQQMQAALATQAIAKTADKPAAIDEEAEAPKGRRARRGSADKEV